MSGQQDHEDMKLRQPGDTAQTAAEAAMPLAEDVAIAPPPPPKHTAVLQKLSAPPFPRSKFPLVGILASVYEHVTEVAARQRGCGGARTTDSSDTDRAA